MIYLTLILTNLLTLAGLIYSVKKSLKLVEMLDDTALQVEESLDIINESYANISKSLESPVMFDDPVIVATVNDMKNAKQSLLLIANKISGPFFEKSDLKEEINP